MMVFEVNHFRPAFARASQDDVDHHPITVRVLDSIDQSTLMISETNSVTISLVQSAALIQ